MSELKRVKIVVSGVVQGVFFRSTAAERANIIGAVGWAKNMPDGTVEIAAEGSGKQLDELIEWCRRGPPLARVLSVDVKWEKPTGEFDAFNIAH